MEPRQQAAEITAEHVRPWQQVVLDGANASELAPEDASMPVTAEINPTLEYKGYQALVSRAVDVFGDELKASQWLSMPSLDLDGKAPLEVAGTLNYDLQEIQKVFEPIFIRIEHGIFV